MRAAYVEQLGPADSIRYGDLPDPSPGPGDVLVDVAATAVNRADAFVRSGLFKTAVQFPLVIGRDAVGVVAQIGVGARGFEVGDAVWCNSLGYNGRQGAAAERVVVPGDRLYHLPPGVHPDDAVAAAHPAATAYFAVITYGRVRPAQTVFVAGAAGNVGSAVVTFAVSAGARVIVSARSADRDYCLSLGATEVVDYRDPSRWQRVRQLCPNGIDVYLDTAGENDMTNAVELLAFRGRIVVLAGVRSQPVLPAGALYMKNGSIVGFVMSNATVDELAQAADAMNDLLLVGKLRPRVILSRPLSEAADAYRVVEDGQAGGTRVILDARGAT